MRLILAFLISLCLSVSAWADPPKTYVVRATAITNSYLPSCGMSRHLMRPRYRMVVYNDTVTVNGRSHLFVGSLPGEALMFSWDSDPDNLVIYWFWTIANDRKLIGLHWAEGVLKDGRLCADTVRIEGKRR